MPPGIPEEMPGVPSGFRWECRGVPGGAACMGGDTVREGLGVSGFCTSYTSGTSGIAAYFAVPVCKAVEIKWRY